MGADIRWGRLRQYVVTREQRLLRERDDRLGRTPRYPA
jgi:hypothetical protein